MNSGFNLYKKSIFTFYLRNSRAEILRCKLWKGNFWFKKYRHYHYRRRRLVSGGEMYCLRFWYKM